MTVAIVLLFLASAPAANPPHGAVDAPDLGTITFRTDASRQDLVAVGARLLEDYGAFSVAIGTERGIALLEERGRYAQAIPRPSFLELAGGPVDLRALSLAPGLGWPVDARGMTTGIVHFHAPIKSSWVQDLRARGISPLRYLPEDALLVRALPSTIRDLSLPSVDWTGPYVPEWKVRPGLPSEGLLDVRIVVFPGDPPEGVEAWLGHRGIPAAAGDGPGVHGAFGSGDFRWVRARIPAGLVPALALLPSVEFIDAAPQVHPWNAETDWVLQTNTTGATRYWAAGLDATGQIIGMADTGLDYDGFPFKQSSSTLVLGDLFNATDAARRKVVRYVNMGVLTGQLTWPGGGGTWDPWSIKDCPYGHGTGVASTLAGNDSGIGTSPNDGLASGGKIYFQDIGGLQGASTCPAAGEQLAYLPEDYANLFGPPGLVYNDPTAPVRIHSDSWGTDTNVYDVQARMIDGFVWAHPDMTIVFAAGNCDPSKVACPLPGSIGSPATAKDLVTVGGAYNPDTGFGLGPNDLAAQSARGPTLDGRIKPTILTLFDGDSAMSDGDPTSGRGSPDAHWAGTSYSTPAAAAAAAIIRQYFVDGWYPAGRPIAANARNPSAALIRAMLIASSQQVTGRGTTARSSSDTWPNNEQGFGRVLLSKVLPLAGDAFGTEVIDENGTGLLTGDALAYTFHVGSDGPVKFVLAWSDYPGTLGAAKALVNDLDLEVRAPDGTVYRGNHFGSFAKGESLADGAFDTTNVEEAILLRAAKAGDWTVRVIGSNVPVGPQPFALVATGNVDDSYGRVVLDRAAYSERDTIRIAVEDSNATSVLAHVTSGLEPAGEDVPLSRGGPGEVWRGSIPTAFGTAVPDGVLQVRERDPIAVTYQDASPAHAASATARILASGPTLHDVTVTGIDATGATIAWETDEPATSELMYGTAPASLTRVSSSADLLTHHSVALRALAPGTRHYFEVASRGLRANTTLDSNGGRTYAFDTPPLGDILVVIGGSSFPPEREASYGAALDGNGWSWSIWRVADLGLPNWTVLRDRRAVIWQVGLEQYPPFNGTERDLIRTYLDRGGRLIISSHDAAWALSDPASAFGTADSAAWVRGVLKAAFTCDPASIGRVNGVTSDPISGTYTAGVSYAPHRDGGADDQVSPISAGGTSTTMWTDGQVTSPDPPAPPCSEGRPIGLRWVSAAPNGTAGDGIWGGTPSRLAYFAFELTGVDATPGNLNTMSTTRSAILDAALRWLVSGSTSSLDRDHADVAITSPNGGTFTGSPISIAWTAAAYGSGVGIANFTLDVSGDRGITWSPIATLPGSSRSYAWDPRSVPNGDRYLLRITARDDGRPSFQAEDTTDATLSIRRAGGDTMGPVLWAGSVRVYPRPPGAGRVVTFNGTADDRAYGGSAISAAELFLQLTEPSANASGGGLPMAAADASFDGPVERVNWQAGLPVAPPGFTCAWVHAQDASGNWGPFSSTCFVVIDAGPDDAPPASASLDELRFSGGGANLSIGWRPSYEDGLYGGATEYQVLRAAAPRGPFTVVGGTIAVNGSARYTFVDPGAGVDPSDAFYRIESRDAAGHTTNSTNLAAKVRLPFSSGSNLLGTSLRLTDPTVLNLFAGHAWSEAWTYDGCAAGFGWSSVRPTDATGFSVPLGRGFWLNGTASDSVPVLGVISQTTRLRLCAGWNLIALPGFATGWTVQALLTATGATRAAGFDAAGPYHVRDLSPSEILVSGRGYWVDVPGDVDWVVPGW